MYRFWFVLSWLCFGSMSLQAQSTAGQPELLRQVPDGFNRMEEIYYEGQLSALHVYQYGTFYRIRRDYLLFISEHSDYPSGIYGILDSTFQRIEEQEVVNDKLEFETVSDTISYRPHYYLRPWPLAQDRAPVADTLLRFPYITKKDTLREFFVDGKLAGAIRFSQIGGERQLSDVYIRTRYQYFYGWHFAPYEMQGMYQRVPTRDSLTLVRVGLWDRKGFGTDRERMYYLNGKWQGLFWQRKNEDQLEVRYYQLGKELFEMYPLQLRAGMSPEGHRVRLQLLDNSWTITENRLGVLPSERKNYLAWQGKAPLPEQPVKYLQFGQNGYLKYRDTKTSDWKEGKWRLSRTEGDKLTLVVEQIDSTLFYQITWSSTDSKHLLLLGLPSALAEK